MSKMRARLLRQAGFTLLELAIVLVVISMLAGGVIAGREVLKSAKLKSVTDDIGTINIAVKDFQKLYGGLPGDLYDAPNKLGNGALRGNGNGVLEANNNYGDNEIRGFWQHLALSGLLPGNFNGASDAPGTGTKAGKLPQSGFYVRTNPTSNELEISFSRFTAGASGASVLTPEQAWELDKKNDDGNPTTGFIRASEGTDAAGNSCVNGGAYNVTNTTLTCIIQTRSQNTGRSVAINQETTATTTASGCPVGAAVGATRGCTCATVGAGMIGTCVERCQAGGTWEYDSVASNCKFPDCTGAGDTSVQAGPGGPANFDTTPDVPVGSNKHGDCPGTSVGYNAAGVMDDTNFPQIKCLAPGGATGLHIKAGGLPSATNPMIGDCRPNTCTTITENCALSGLPALSCTFPGVGPSLNSTVACPSTAYKTNAIKPCSAGSAWQTQTTSCDINCTGGLAGAQSSVTNGSFTGFSLSGMTWTRNFTCSSGYTASGSSTCTAPGGAWSNTATCTADPCTTQSLPCGGGQNCSFTAIASGMTRTATCPAGYGGAPTSLCTTGTWGAVGGTACSQCAAASLSCGSGQNCAFAATASGSSASSTCPPGYTGTPSATCTGGVWGAVGGTLCSATPSCGVPPSFPNVNLTGSGTNLGDTRVARCDALGWYFGMPTQLDCSNPGPAWIGAGPTCVTLNCAVNDCTAAGGDPVECTNPATCPNNTPCGPVPPGPFGAAPSGSGFSYASLRTYTCDRCFGAGAAGTEVARYICDNTSNWKGYESGTCTAGVDPRPTVANGTLLNLRKVGAQWISDVQCDAGYSLQANANGNATTTCNSGTTAWTAAGNCVKPIIISNGALVYDTWTTGGTPMKVDDGIQLLSTSTSNMTSATVQITAGLDTANDFLEFTNQLGITGTYTAATGTLALTGSTTVANYQTALRSVRFRNRLVAAAGCGARTITVWAAIPGFGTPPSASRNVMVNAQTFNAATYGSNIRGWYEADSPTPVANGTRIGNLPDSSANGNTMVVHGGGTAYRPVYNTNAVNGRPVLYFDNSATGGRTQMYSNAAIGISGNAAITQFGVGKGVSGGWSFSGVGDAGCASWWIFRIDSNQNGTGGSCGHYYMESIGRTDYRVVYGAKTPGPYQGTITLRENGVAPGSYSGTPSSTVNISGVRLVLGGIFSTYLDTSYDWTGYFAETIIYNSNLTIANVQTVESYLAGKWWVAEMAQDMTRASNTAGGCAGMCTDSAPLSVGAGPNQVFASALNGQSRLASCGADFYGAPQRTCTAGAWGALSGTCAACPVGTPTTVTIPATTSSAIDTGVDVQAGCSVRFISSGKWRTCTGTGNLNTMQVGLHDPSRQSVTGLATNCPVGYGPDGWGIPEPNFGFATCKIGQTAVKVGAGGTWECIIGDDFSLTPTTSGRLYVQMNDYLHASCGMTNCYTDNMGQMKVTIYK